MVNVGIFYDHLKYFMAIWYNSWPFGIVCGHLLYFSQFGMFFTKKNLATLVVWHDKNRINPTLLLCRKTPTFGLCKYPVTLLPGLCVSTTYEGMRILHTSESLNETLYH
jgi:hypothetical protein